MKADSFERIILSGLFLASFLMILTLCASNHERQKKNNELIKLYSLVVRTLTGACFRLINELNSQ